MNRQTSAGELMARVTCDNEHGDLSVHSYRSGTGGKAPMVATDSFDTITLATIGSIADAPSPLCAHRQRCDTTMTQTTTQSTNDADLIVNVDAVERASTCTVATVITPSPAHARMVHISHDVLVHGDSTVSRYALIRTRERMHAHSVSHLPTDKRMRDWRLIAQLRRAPAAELMSRQGRRIVNQVRASL
jgi:hypothetical protein